MKITFCKRKLSVKSSFAEGISFDKNVNHIYKNYVDEIQEELNNYGEDDFDEDAIKMQAIINYKLTNDDKFKTLEKIVDNFEYEYSYHGNCAISIYDEDLIKSGIRNYLEIKFGILLW